MPPIDCPLQVLVPVRTRKNLTHPLQGAAHVRVSYLKRVTIGQNAVNQQGNAGRACD